MFPLGGRTSRETGEVGNRFRPYPYIRGETETDSQGASWARQAAHGVETPTLPAKSPRVQKYSGFGPSRGRNTPALGPAGAEMGGFWALPVHLWGSFRALGEANAAWREGGKSAQDRAQLGARGRAGVTPLHEEREDAPLGSAYPLRRASAQR
jgi:hypothetical protein